MHRFLKRVRVVYELSRMKPSVVFQLALEEGKEREPSRTRTFRLHSRAHRRTPSSVMRKANANASDDSNDRTRSTPVAFGRGTSTPRRSTLDASGVRASSSMKKRATQRALFTVEATEDANASAERTSPVTEAIHAARATLQTASYSTFASRGLATETTRTPPAVSPMDWDRTATGRTPIGDSVVEEGCCTPSSVYKPPCSTPKERARLGLEPKTPLSVKVSTLVKDAMTALKEGRSRMESLVKSHRGKGLKFSDEDDDERIAGNVEIVVASNGCDSVISLSAQPTVSQTASQDDREAHKEATEMLLRSAKKTSVSTPKALVSPLRSPKPLTMTRLEPGVPMAVLADSKTTDAPMMGEETTTDCVDEEVTSQVSLPPGFNPSEFLQCGGDENKKASDVCKSADADEPSGIDIFVRMMGKVIADTFQELQNVAQNAIAEPDSVKTLNVEEKVSIVDEQEEVLPPKSSEESPEKPTPRRSARRKSGAKDALSTPTRRSGRSKDPVTPTRRSKRLASQNKSK